VRAPWHTQLPRLSAARKNSGFHTIDRCCRSEAFHHPSIAILGRCINKAEKIALYYPREPLVDLLPTLSLAFLRNPASKSRRAWVRRGRVSSCDIRGICCWPRLRLRGSSGRCRFAFRRSPHTRLQLRNASSTFGFAAICRSATQRVAAATLRFHTLNKGKKGRSHGDTEREGSGMRGQSDGESRWELKGYEIDGGGRGDV